MKKKLIIVLLFFSFLFSFFYFLLPSNIKIDDTLVIRANFNNISRQLLDTIGWKNWLPVPKEKSNFQYNNLEFIKAKSTNENALGIKFVSHKKEYNLYLMATSLSFDSVLVEYKTTVKSDLKFLGRIQNYFIAKEINSSLKSFLNLFKDYAEDPSLFYGFKPRLIKLQDSCMVAIKASSENYPSITEIYNEIDLLYEYINKNNATAINAPMLNVKAIEPFGYEFMVSLPINKKLNNNGKIIYKQLLPNGNFLVTDSIVGDAKKVSKLFESFENYKNDYRLTSPAIPFQSLITNRVKEKDSTKWITKFYYPIF